MMRVKILRKSRFCDIIAVLDNGGIVEYGMHEA